MKIRILGVCAGVAAAILAFGRLAPVFSRSLFTSAPKNIPLEVPSAPGEDAAAFLRAYEASAFGEEQALEELQALMRREGPLSGPAVLAAVETMSALQPQRSRDVAGIVDEWSQRELPPRFTASLVEAAVDALLRDGRPDDALRLVRAAGGAGEQTPRLLGALAAHYRREGCQEDFEALVREILTEHAASAEAAEWSFMLSQETFASRLGDMFWRSRAQKLYEASRSADAMAALESLRHRQPEDEELEGLCLYRRGLYARAAAPLSHAGTSRALYHLALCHAKLKHDVSYQSVAGRLLETGARDEWWGRMGLRRSRELREAGDAEAAERLLRQVALEAPDSGQRKDALWSMAWADIWSGDYSAASGFLESYLAIPDLLHWEERLRANYWLARCREAAGMKGRAAQAFAYLAEEYPNHYYGVLSRQRIESLPLAAPEPPGSSAWARTEAPPPAWGKPPFVETAELMAAAGLEGEARRWLDMWFDRNSPHPYLWTLELQMALREGDQKRAMRAFDRLPGCEGVTLRTVQDWLPREAMQGLYRLDYAGLIARESERRSLDPLLAAAVIQQESLFNPRAVSRAGARGLMQIMPGTGRLIARAHGEKFATGNLYHAETNVRYGTWYLASLLARFEGRVELALAGYNGGPNRVARWWSEWREPELDVFVDNIPIDETRIYVKRVLTHYARYKMLYGPAPESSPAL